MNCANHDTAAVAFCRTCGKPLCGTCTRDVRGVVYCEPCLAARLESTSGCGVHGIRRRRKLAIRRSGSLAPSAANARPRIRGRRHSGRIFPLRRGSSLLLAIRQGTGASADFRLADFRFRSCRKLWYVAVWHRHRIFLRLPDHRRCANRHEPCRKASLRPIHLAWLRRSAWERRSSLKTFRRLL